MIEPHTLLIQAPEGFDRKIASLQVALESGLFVVMGRNNAGKTRFLEAVAKSRLVGTLPIHHCGPLKDHVVRLLGSESLVGMTLNVSWGRKDESAQTLEWYFSKPFPQATDLIERYKGELRQSIGGQCRVRPSHHVSTQRYFNPVGALNQGMNEDSLQNLAAFFETQGSQLETRDTAAKIRAMFTDITEGLALEVATRASNPLERYVVITEAGAAPRPMEQCGDGLRDLFVLLMKTIIHKDEDLLLDEPGLRLHPHAQRRLLGFLEGQAKHRSIWIATHDGVFIGAPTIRARFVITRSNLTSHVNELCGAEEVRKGLSGLGWLGRDAYLAERVLYCEGASDAEVFRSVISRLAVRQPDMGATVVEPLGGEGAVRSRGGNGRVLQTVRLMCKVAPHARHVVILDKATTGDSERRALAELLKKEGIGFYVLERHELENYFLNAALLRQMLQTMLEGTDSMMPAESDLVGRLKTHDAVTSKGSVVLDEIWNTVAKVAYDKVFGARLAASLMITHSPESARQLDGEVYAALGSASSGPVGAPTA